jgi:hypothetical protein
MVWNAREICKCKLRRRGFVVIVNCLTKGALHSFFGLTRPFLYPANQLVFFAVNISQIIVCKLSPLLFQLAFGDIPISFDF